MLSTKYIFGLFIQISIILFIFLIPSLLQVHVLKAMRHPYIITYKESFMDKRHLCIVMDYADGGDLYTKIANQKKIGKGTTLTN
jgi:serine/threonine protein kinase